MRRALIVIAAIGTLALLGCCRPGSNPGTGPEAAIVAAATWTAWLAATYLGAAVGVAAVTRSGNRVVAWLVPNGLHGVVRRALGVGTAAAVIGTGVVPGAPAWADAHRPMPPTVSADWPLPEQATRSVVVVKAGDCLWTLAADSLRDPTSARTARTWPRWWRANRDVVGSNPNLIHPGQRLHPPASPRSAT